MQYISGRTSQFSNGGIDKFTPAKDTQGKNEGAVNADLWNQAASAVVAIQRKLCGCSPNTYIGNACNMFVSPSDGRIYFSDRDTAAVIVLNADGTQLYRLTHGDDWGPDAVCVNEPAGVIYVTSRTYNCIYEFSKSTGSYIGTFKPDLLDIPVGIAYHQADDTLHILSWDGGVCTQYVYNSTTGAYVSSPSTGMTNIRTGLDGYVYGITRTGAIYQFYGSGNLGSLSTGSSHCYMDIAASSDGTIYVLDAGDRSIAKITSGNVESASRIDSKGLSWQLTPTSGGLPPANSLAIDTDGYLYVADSGVIRKIDPTTSSMMDMYADDSFAPVTAKGTQLVGKMTVPDSCSYLKNTVVPYPGKTFADRWKRVIVNTPGANTTSTTDTDVSEAYCYLDFIVKPTEFVWPSDIRVSITGGQADAYFHSIPEGYATTLSDGNRRLRYKFAVVNLSRSIPYLPKNTTFTVNALAYVSSL